MGVYGYIIVGLVAGVASGLLGIGGGTIIIPILVYIYGLTQHQAQGTTLALMVLPIGLLAALRYYWSGNVDIRMAAYICVGFFLGGLLGAVVAQPLPDLLLKKAFGIFLIIVAFRMILGK